MFRCVFRGSWHEDDGRASTRARQVAFRRSAEGANPGMATAGGCPAGHGVELQSCARYRARTCGSGTGRAVAQLLERPTSLLFALKGSDEGGAGVKGLTWQRRARVIADRPHLGQQTDALSRSRLELTDKVT